MCIRDRIKLLSLSGFEISSKLNELINDYFDEEDKKWRNNTVLMWDNAGYHAADSVLTLLRDQQVPMLFLGPYSYRTAPAEMVFAALKVQHLNVYDAPLGKK